MQLCRCCGSTIHIPLRGLFIIPVRLLIISYQRIAKSRIHRNIWADIHSVLFTLLLPLYCTTSVWLHVQSKYYLYIIITCAIQITGITTQQSKGSLRWLKNK